MLKLFQEWQSSLYSLLQNQTFNQVEVDLFELMCKVLDQNLFAQVDWARNSYYFKELKVGTNFWAEKRNKSVTSDSCGGVKVILDWGKKVRGGGCIRHWQRVNIQSKWKPSEGEGGGVLRLHNKLSESKNCTTSACLT